MQLDLLTTVLTLAVIVVVWLLFRAFLSSGTPTAPAAGGGKQQQTSSTTTASPTTTTTTTAAAAATTTPAGSTGLKPGDAVLNAPGRPVGALRVRGMLCYPIKSCAPLELTEGVMTASGFVHDRQWMVVVDETKNFITQRQQPGMALIRPSFSASGRLVLSAPNMADLEVVPPAKAQRVTVHCWAAAVEADDQGDAAAAWLTQALEKHHAHAAGTAAAGEGRLGGAAVPALRLVHFGEAARRAVDDQEVRGDSPNTVRFVDNMPLLLATDASMAELNRSLGAGDAVPIARFRPNIVVEGAAAAWAENAWARVRIGAHEFNATSDCTRCKLTTVQPADGVFAANQQPLSKLRETHSNDKGEPVFGRFLMPVSAATGAVLHVGDPVEVLATDPAAAAAR